MKTVGVQRGWLGAAVVVLMAWMGGPAGVCTVKAALLNLPQQPPDVFSDFITVQYDSASDTFRASGFAETFDIDGTSPPDYIITGGTFDILATVTSSGAATGGTLSIMGMIPALGATDPLAPLLTGTVSQFGFQDPPGGDLFEFVFDVTGGSLANHLGTKTGVILNAMGLDPQFNGSFATSFSNVNNFGMGISDTFVAVPEPSSLALLLCACLGVLATRCWRRRR